MSTPISSLAALTSLAAGDLFAVVDISDTSQAPTGTTKKITQANVVVSFGLGALATVTPGTGVATALAIATGSAGGVILIGGAAGTPSSITLTNGTGLPISTGLTGTGTGVLTALAVNVGSAGAFVVLNGALGTPSSGTLTSATGLPISTGLTGAGTGVLTALAVNTGTAGCFVVNGGALGSPSSGTLSSCTGYPANALGGLASSMGTFLTTASSASLAATITDETGTGALMFATNPGLTITAPTTNTVGYLGIPQNSNSAAYTTVLSDSGKHIFHPSADTTARTFTIDSNANVAYPIGTALTFINQNAGGVITIAITSDTMRLAGAGTTGSRTLAANGIATAVKVANTEWLINGTGLT